MVVVQLFIGDFHFVCRHLAIDLFGKDGKQFGTPGLLPLLRGGNFLAACCFQQGWQGVRRNLAFVVVGFFCILCVQAEQAEC